MENNEPMLGGGNQDMAVGSTANRVTRRDTTGPFQHTTSEGVVDASTTWNADRENDDYGLELSD